MTAKDIRDLGAVVEGFNYHPARLKAGNSRMWGGDCKLHLNGMTFDCMLWSHLGMEVTEEEIWERMSIKGIEIDGEYYDVCWHTVNVPNNIWLHREGWFGHFFNKDKHPEAIDLFTHTKAEYKGDHWNKGNGAWDMGWSRSDYSEATDEEFLELGFESLFEVEEAA